MSDTALIDFFAGYLPMYEPITYDVTTVYQCANPITGVITETTVVNTIVPDGIAGVDFNWIAVFVLLMLIVYVIYQIPKLSLYLFDKYSNPTRYKFK